MSGDDKAYTIHFEDPGRIVPDPEEPCPYGWSLSDAEAGPSPYWIILFAQIIIFVTIIYLALA